MQGDTSSIELSQREMEEDEILISFNEEFQDRAGDIILESTPHGIVAQLLSLERGEWVLLSKLVEQTGEATRAIQRLCELKIGEEAINNDNLFICWTPDPVEATFAFIHVFSNVGMSHFLATVNRTYFHSSTESTD